jgi:drug/metabolite transporter (DMT)-like permease
VRRSSLTLVAVCATWGTIPLVARRIDLPPAAIVFGRVWVAAAALAVVDRTRPRATEWGDARPRLPVADRNRIALLGVLLAVHWTAMFAGYQRAPADVVVFVVFLAPVGVAAAAPRILGEAVGARTLAALAVAVTGFALVAGPTAVDRGSGAESVVLGVVAAAVAAITLVALVLASKPLAERHGGPRLARLQLTAAGIVLLPVAAFVDWGRPRAAFAWLAVLGLVHTAIGVSAYFGALARVPATHAGILGYLEPVTVVACAWLVLGEPPSSTTVVGGLLIVAAGTAVVAGPEKQGPEKQRIVRVPG